MVIVLKGQCHEMDICFEGLNISISTFCVCADGFQGLLKAFQYTVVNFFCFFEITYLLILKMLTETFSVIGRCFPVAIYHWLQEKCARINLS
jgi:hypothetical protein